MKDDLILEQISHSAKEKLFEFEAIREQQKSRNRNFIQNIVVILLLLEVIFISYLMLCQGTGKLIFSENALHFSLNEWGFYIYSSGVILQTFFLLKPIINYLFSKKQT